MNDIERRLTEEKKRLETITAPEELETRLRSALDTATRKRTIRRVHVWKLATVALFFVIIASYQYNAFAYYGKKILGFDEVVYGTLKELNEQGMGQIVEKKTILEDGTVLAIEGIMTDANQLVMYYSLSNPEGLEEGGSDFFRPVKITGFLTDSYVESGVSNINEEHTEIKGTYSFEPVSPFSKNLTLHFYQSLPNHQVKDDSLSFAYDPNQAMQTQIKQSIKQKLKVDKGTIKFDSITATPTMTIITGTLHVENFDRIQDALSGIQLIANGQPIEQIGSGHRSALNGRKFDIRYDVLPQHLDSLELVMKDFVGYQSLDEKISLASIGDNPTKLGDKELWVQHVSKTSQGVEITIATDEDVLLDGVSIESQHEIIPLKTTINQIETKLPDGRLVKERTLLFDTLLKPEYLLIEGMHYRKAYNQVIEIPVD